MLLKRFSKNLLEAGCDEAGRGCLAGPVVAAAVILPDAFENEELNDSKKLNEKSRIKLRKLIENEALAWSVSVVNNHEIDQFNILNASFLAMQRAVDGLQIKPELLLIDGNRFRPHATIPHECIVKGDGKFLSIAAASVLAKTYRDEIMSVLHHKFPGYQWNRNKGYPTKVHREALAQIGASPFHRVSFNLLGDGQLSLF